MLQFLKFLKQHMFTNSQQKFIRERVTFNSNSDIILKLREHLCFRSEGKVQS